MPNVQVVRKEPWQNQKDLQDSPIPSYTDIIEMAQGIEQDRDRALFILAYLTAGRISEITSYRRHGKNLPGIHGTDVFFTERKGFSTFIIKMPNRKNKKRRFKTIPINPTKEEILIALCYPYVKSRGNAPVFPISIQRGWQIMNKLNMNPHYLRHVRLSHLVTEFNFTDQELTRFSGWVDSRPARHYVELRWIDLRRRMED